MTVSFAANPGQTVGLVVEVLDGYGTRVDGYAPTLDFVLDPNDANLAGFSATLMTRLSTGLYKANLTLPSGASAVGTYVASASWTDPEDATNTFFEAFTINVALPFGNSSVSPL